MLLALASPAQATTLSDLGRETLVADNGVTFGGFVGVLEVPPGTGLGAADIVVEPTGDGIRLVFPGLNLTRHGGGETFFLSDEASFRTNAHALTVTPAPGPSAYPLVHAMLNGPMAGLLNFDIPYRGVCASDGTCLFQTAPQAFEIHATMPEPSTWVLVVTGVVWWLARACHREGAPWKTT